ncbi:MAG: hypothetical protein WC050_04570 [Candidatus Paceibacterota bacterium]
MSAIINKTLLRFAREARSSLILNKHIYRMAKKKKAKAKGKKKAKKAKKSR